MAPGSSGRKGQHIPRVHSSPRGKAGAPGQEPFTGSATDLANIHPEALLEGA